MTRLVLLISENGSHITIVALLPRKVLNKQRFSINKSLGDINFYFCFEIFLLFRTFFSFKRFFGVIMSTVVKHGAMALKWKVSMYLMAKLDAK